MAARTELDRLTAARPAVLHRTEDVIDAAEEDRILRQILFSGHEAPTPGSLLPQAPARPLRRRVSGAVPRPAALGLVAAAVIAAVILAVTVLAPATHQPVARLAAWTVATQTDGTIALTIRELSDPAGLQRTLRADGIPATVTFASRPAPPCRALNAIPAPWTVAKQTDGTIALTIRELSDPVGLQRTLRADGIPATVTFASRPAPPCHALRALAKRTGK
jgi:hypothetical protein